MMSEVAPTPPSDDRSGPGPLTIVILAVIAIVALVALSAFLPRWWAHRVGDQVDGSFASGIGLGLLYGFVFTALPLAIAWFALRRIGRWKWAARHHRDRPRARGAEPPHPLGRARCR